MFFKRIGAICIAILLSLSMCIPVFAAVSLEDYDTEMYENVKEIIETEIKDESVKTAELEILEAFYTKIKGDDTLTHRGEGSKVISEIASDKNVKDTQWKAVFAEMCDKYEVKNTEMGAGLDSTDDMADANATSKLHILQWDADTSGVNNSAMKDMLQDIINDQAMKSVMGVCISLGAALCIAFGIGDIVEKATEKSVSTESIWRAFLKMCVGLFVIFNCLYIAAAIIYVGNIILTAALDNTGTVNGVSATAYRTHTALWASIASMEQTGGVSTSISTAATGLAGIFNSVVTSVTGFIEDIQTELGGGALMMGPISLFGSTIGTMLMKLAGSGIISFITSLTVYAVAIDIGIRFTLTPLAVADLFSEKFRSTGVKWLKGIAASALQGVIIYLTIMIGTSLRETLAGGAAIPGFAPVTGLIVNLSMLGMFVKSRGYAQEIVGMH